MSEFDAKKVKDEIIIWIRNWFNSNGKDCVAVVGISGGKDSSVVAALCVEALGKDRVFGVLMPQGKQKDIDYSYKLCNFLDIKHISVHIGITVNSLQNEIAISLKKPLSTQTITNLPARIRMTSLYAVAQTINGRVANTCNLSETLLSWETRWGDQVGDFSPLADLTVQEVKAIGYELGLPECLIEKTPSDGLCGSSDEEAFGFTYAVVDKYIRTGKIDDLDVKFKIDERVTKYRFKRLELPHYESGLKRYID